MPKKLRWIALGLVLWLYGALPIFGYSYGQVVLDNRIAFDTVVCQTEEEFTLGLGYKPSLDKSQAMLFPYFQQAPKERIFWMKGMLFPIDILWIKEGKIVHIEHNLKPPSALAKDLALYGQGVLADAVLEIKGGQSYALGLAVGQSFSFKALK